MIGLLHNNMLVILVLGAQICKRNIQAFMNTVVLFHKAVIATTLNCLVSVSKPSSILSKPA